MNNYTKIKNMTPNEMAKFFTVAEYIKICDAEFIDKCMRSNNYCKDSNECPVNKEKMFLK